MVKSGLVDKNKTSELDKTPWVSPYRLLIHGSMAYIIYSLTFYNALNLIWKPQEHFIHLKNFVDHSWMKSGVTAVFHSLILVYLYGFLTAGNWAGHAMNTYPKVGNDWFPSSKHLNKDVSLW